MNTPEPELRIRESYAGERRPINTDPREQRGPAMNPGLSYQPQWPPGPASMMSPRQRHSPWYWMVIGFVMVVVILGGLATFALVSTHTITLASKSFTVGDQPALVLNDHSADVHIVSGPNHQITVEGTERLSTWSANQIPLHYQQSGDTITVTIDDTNHNIGLGLFYQHLQIDVTVPGQTNLTVTSDSGDITSDGVTGQMSLHTDSGNITTNGGSGQITLNADSGDIHASNINGQMTLTTSSGSITATNASASGASLFQSDSGDIHFGGSLADTGTDHFKASSGSITLTLPNDAAFQVQASTDSGDIHSEFAGVNVLHGDGSGATAVGRTGNGSSFAQVTIQTDSGDISLHRA